MNNVKTILSALLMLVSSLFSVAQEAPTNYTKTLVVTTADGTQTKFALKEKPQLTIEKPYLVVKTNGIKTGFELEQMVSLKYKNVPVVPGDAYEDGLINTTDITTMVNYLMGKRTSKFNFSNADANDDEAVNVADIVKTGNIIHSGVYPATSRGENQNRSQTATRSASSSDSGHSQYALYNYRNDANFNAWLNIDIDSITYSKTDALGVEHKDFVVQEVWTPDSTYRIPIEAIDSIGFRAPEPIMREGIFYLEDYHAAHITAIDGLTLYFDSSTDMDRIPSVGQVVLHERRIHPYEEGFAGRVASIDRSGESIKVECEMICVGDVYKRLVMVGQAISASAAKARGGSRASKAEGDPWKKFEDQDVIVIDNLPDLKFEAFDGMYSVTSKDPLLTIRYNVYVDEWTYLMSANIQIDHNEYEKKIALSLEKIKKLADDKYDDKIVDALTKMWTYKNEGRDAWIESLLNDKIAEENAEKESDEEIDVINALWKDLHGSWTIPIVGPLLLDLELGPLLKFKGGVELDFTMKSKARNTLYVEASGNTMATLTNPKIALATGLAKIKGSSSFHSEPVSSLRIDTKLNGTLSAGITGKATLSLIHKNVVHASVSAQGGIKFTGSLDMKFHDIEVDEFDWGVYEFLKDTKISSKLFSKFALEFGVSPIEFFTVGVEWEPEFLSKDLGSIYLFPQFTQPALPTYKDGLWSNGSDRSHLALLSSPSKSLPCFLLGPCHLGMRITDEIGMIIKETEHKRTYDGETIVWGLDPLSIDLDGLEPGKVYRCYPTFNYDLFKYFGWSPIKATPSYEFTVPNPVSVRSSSLIIKKGEAKDIAISGGWGSYQIINESNKVEAWFNNVEESDASDGTSGSSSSDGFISNGGAGGGGSSWGPSMIWYSSWPSDETPTIHLYGQELGETTIQVKDMRSNETTSINVVVTDEETPSLQLSSTLLTLVVGKKGTVTVSSGSGNYTVESSDPDVATVKINNGSIEVTAVKADNTTITVTDTESNLTATIEVTITEEDDDDESERDSYVVYEDGKLTFYCDSHKKSRSGDIFSIPDGKPTFWPSEIQDNVETVVFDSSFAKSRPTTTRYWFAQFINLSTIEGIEYLNTSNVSSMEGMFFSCLKLTTLDLSSFNTSKVTNMSNMFNVCENIKSLDVSSFNTANVTNMYFMFGDCISLESLDVSNFNTANVTDMRGMFGGCVNVKALDVSNFNTANVTNMGLMFEGCRNIKSLDVSNFNTANVTDMGRMFVVCMNLESLDVSNFNTAKVTDMHGMFGWCGGLNSLDVSNFNTENVTNMEEMFSCSELTSIDVSNFNTAKVTNMKRMFQTCTNLQSLDLSNFDTSKVTNMCDMFNDCYELELLNIDNFDTSNVTDMSNMFFDCKKLKTIYCGNVWNTEKATYQWCMFQNCTSLVGEKGTKYDENHTDAEYARIDGGPDSPGYFTDINTSQQNAPAEAVDLGLPSGTLWASCNVGATKPEEVGGYYAWGETEEKTSYTKDTYLYWSSQFNGGDEIGENICGTNYDVAHVKWSQGWQMPNLDQIKELLENCSHEIVELNNVKVMKFTGTNGNSIFFPITGLYIGNNVYGKDDYCVYWTGIPPTPGGTAAYFLYIDGKGETHWDYLPENRYYRYYGMPIRPVLKINTAGSGSTTISGGDEV